jgi:hypothetical protein
MHTLLAYVACFGLGAFVHSLWATVRLHTALKDLDRSTAALDAATKEKKP